MADFQLDIDAIRANPNSQIIMAGFGRAVTCFLQEGLGFSAGNVFGNAFESEALNKASDIATKVTPAIGAVTEKLGLGSVKNLVPKTFANTVESWTGPTKPSFSIKTIFIAVRPGDDVTKDVKTIMAACFPTRQIGGTMGTPLNYGLKVSTAGDLNLSATGTVSMKIGTWFQAFGLVVESAHPKFSAQVIKSGKPLYCEMDITLKPFKAISYGEFLGYFIS